MAERRMIAKTITLSDAFLEMPATARCLYFTLLQSADDDGFVNNPRSLMRLTSATDDDMKILLAKKFVLIFENGVIVIKHWRIHNYIQKDRYIETKYKDEKARLELDENNAYKMTGSNMDTTCIQTVYTGKDSIGKLSIGKNNNGGHFVPPTRDDIAEYCAEKSISIDIDRFLDYYTSNGWKVGRNSMKDWKATVRNWARKDNGQSKTDAFNVNIRGKDEEWI